MTQRSVEIERYVEQVVDGRHYKGHVTVGGNRFDYELAFALPIEALLKLESTTDETEFRRRFQVTLRRGDESIALTRDEYGFFVDFLGSFVLRFYEHAQTRDANQGGLGAMIRGEGLFGVDGMSARIGMNETGTCRLTPAACEMLTQPKFGCVIPSA